MPGMARKAKAPSPSGQIQLFKVPEVAEPYKKAVEVLHSKPRSPMSLMHRKLLNAWLKNALEGEPDKDGWWDLSIMQMCNDIGFDSHNRAHLIEAARELMSIVFEWNVLGDGQGEQQSKNWKASVLFPNVELTPAVIRYQINEQLQEKVLNPEIYALIDQRIIRQFRRATSIAIYEFCVRFKRLPRTPAVAWEALRDMIMGKSAGAKSYKQYKIFNDKVLKPAVAEVNTVVADLEIELQQVYSGRKVQGLYFILRKRDPELAMAFDSPDELTDTAALVSLGLPQSEAARLVKTHRHDEIEAAIDYTRRRMSAKNKQPLENPAAYLRRALAEKWAVVDDAHKPAKTSAAPKTRDQTTELELACQALRDKDAESYFYELDAAEQQPLIDEYNGQQTLAPLRIKTSGKQTKASTGAFFRWLAMKTWGEITPDVLVKYASELLFSKRPS